MKRSKYVLMHLFKNDVINKIHYIVQAKLKTVTGDWFKEVQKKPLAESVSIEQEIQTQIEVEEDATITEAAPLEQTFPEPVRPIAEAETPSSTEGMPF